MAEVLRVLAHPHRLRIVEFLERYGDTAVYRIAKAIELEQAPTSHHLNHMKRVGLVSSRRQGKEVLYRIADAHAVTILDCIRRRFSERGLEVRQEEGR